MRPIDVYAMIAIPLALAMVLGLVLFSGRMSPATRTRVERVMAGVFYPMAVVFWLWRAVGFYREGELLSTAAMAVVAILFVWLGVKAVRAGRVAPGSGPGS